MLLLVFMFTSYQNRLCWKVKLFHRAWRWNVNINSRRVFEYYILQKQNWMNWCTQCIDLWDVLQRQRALFYFYFNENGMPEVESFDMHVLKNYMHRMQHAFIIKVAAVAPMYIVPWKNINMFLVHQHQELKDFQCYNVIICIVAIAVIIIIIIECYRRCRCQWWIWMYTTVWHGMPWHGVEEVMFSTKQKKKGQASGCSIHKTVYCLYGYIYIYKWQCVDTMFIVNNENDMSSWKFGTFGWLSCDISISNRKIKPKWLRTFSFNIHTLLFICMQCICVCASEWVRV